MANQKKAASPGYKTPNEKFNEEFAEESTATVAQKAKASRNATTPVNKQQ
ncbi:MULTISPECIES: hypothetical protein [Paenibacillus]|jgi:hypothetical protein|uniref:Uncharacterized protein n=5 Tax=Paenibacillus TaxID=44249 RepID=A0A9X1XXW5_9BACL|nr:MULTISPECIES: hypothetical protein [Paenibacillus]MBW4839949.1 hypothetical protein [Paenibacillaceae bacterium]GJM80991.1 hypothetical protein HMSSN139_34870 [Paenibacillus sp. HMSSN-139]EOS55895.1 hypothetical protein C812_02475 [Paenibacillus barengoltzii G22]MBM6997671.1 hypothetical protein [Paenibacillus rhizolycopersici]MCH1642612.1 hypothetical protein [Paenibacillus timonensis]